MKRSLTLCAVALMAFAQSSVQADDISIDLEYDTNSSTWELFAEVTGSGSPDGSIGISAVRALINGINFGDATIASGIGAITASGSSPTVLDLGGGLIEVLYGQDISSTGTVVANVGTSGRSLIASGGYASVPSFGSDGALVTQGLFLTSTTAGGGNAIDPGANVLGVTDVTSGGIPGDFSGSGSVGNDDLTLLLDNWGNTVPPVPTGWVNDFATAPNVGNDDLTRLLDNWGNSSSAVAASVPEPTTLAIAFLASISGLAFRRVR